MRHDMAQHGTTRRSTIRTHANAQAHHRRDIKIVKETLHFLRHLYMSSVCQLTAQRHVFSLCGGCK